MKIIIIIIFIIFIIPPIYAADSTPSADISSKLKEFQKSAASKAAQLKELISEKLQNKAYTGHLSAKSDKSLTLTTKSGSKIVTINQDTEFISLIKSKKKFSQKTLAEKDYLASLGDVDETGILTARKVVLLPTPNPNPKTFLLGQVVAVSDGLITVKDKHNKNMAVSLANPSQIKVSNSLILTGFKGKNDIFQAEFVYIIPQSGILKPKKIATPSAYPPITH